MRMPVPSWPWLWTWPFDWPCDVTNGERWRGDFVLQNTSSRMSATIGRSTGRVVGQLMPGVIRGWRRISHSQCENMSTGQMNGRRQRLDGDWSSFARRWSSAASCSQHQLWAITDLLLLLLLLLLTVAYNVVPSTSLLLTSHLLILRSSKRSEQLVENILNTFMFAFLNRNWCYTPQNSASLHLLWYAVARFAIQSHTFSKLSSIKCSLWSIGA